MPHSTAPITTIISTLPARACLISTTLLASLAFAEERTVDANVQQARFEPPADGDPGVLLKFMQRLAKPGHNFQSRDAAERYSRRAARAIVKTADRIVKGPAKDRQKIRAVEMKLRSLRLLGGLGDNKAQRQATTYLGKIRNHENPAIATAGVRMHVSERIARWRVMSDAEKQQLLDEVTADVLRDRPTIDKVRLLTFVGDVLGDMPDRDLVLATIEPLMPHLATLREEHGPESTEAQKLAALEGVVRRLKLPGQPIEVEGKLLTGEPIDWQKYRGKVVLIDYWATWCGLCKAEMPNVRRLHEQYGDQGFEIVGVCLDEDPKLAKQFLNKQEFPWPTLIGHDEATRGWNHPMVQKYGIFDLPRAILVDREGRVVHVNARGEQLATALEQLFQQPVAVESAGDAGQTVQLDQPAKR